MKPNFFFANKLHLLKEGNTKLTALIYHSTNPRDDINKTVSSKLFACDTDLNLSQEDFPMLLCTVSLRSSACKPNAVIAKFC